MNAISTSQSVAVRSEHHGLAYAELEKLAASIAESGLFGIKTKAQAIALMMIAHAEGRHPALAARDYDIISGRPAKKSEAMLRDFLEGGGKVQWHTLDDNTADATFSHPSGGSVRINWNMERAAKAGLATKENYKRFARQMLRSRTVSEGVRTVYPLATSGMYVPEEAADIAPADTFAGPTIEAKPEPPPEPRPASERQTLRQVVARLVVEMGQVQSIGGLADLEAREETQKVLARGPSSDAAAAVLKARDAARERLAVIVDDGWPGPETGEITPADRLMSG